MAASALDMGEDSVLSAECRWKRFEHGEAHRGTLFFTSTNRLVFVTSSGLLSKKYKKSHSIHVSDVSNVRSEEGAFGFGKRLVIEWNYEGTPVTYRYEGINNPEEWVNRITEPVKAARRIDRAYNTIIRIIKSQETTTFDEIEELICSVRPDFAGKTEDEKNREIVNILSRCIDQGLVEGFVDAENRQFTHLIAYKQKAPLKEREIIKKTIVMVPCPYCGGLMPNTAIFCPHCGAKRKA
jgi:hypothetical protein